MSKNKWFWVVVSAGIVIILAGMIWAYRNFNPFQQTDGILTESSLTDPEISATIEGSPGFVKPSGPVRVKYQKDDQYLIVEFLDDDLVHFEVSAFNIGGDIDRPIYTTPMVVMVDYKGPETFRDDGQGTLESGEIMVQVDPESLCVTVTDMGREPDLRLTTFCPWQLKKDFKGITFTPESFTHAYGLGEKFIEAATSDGDWIGRERYPGDFGNVQEPFNNGNVGNDQFPVLYLAGQGLENYALFVDNPYKQYWNFVDTPWKVAMEGKWVRFYILVGPDIQDLRRDFMELVGKPLVPPKRAFGLWISEYGFDNWEEMEAKLKTLRENRFPVDGFVLDLQWYGGNTGGSDDTRMGSLSWDLGNFPNPEEKIARLESEQGVGIILIEQSYIGKNLTEHAGLQNKGFLVKKCADCDPVYLTVNPWWGMGGMLDWSNPEAGAFWHDWKREALIEAGIVGHWTDLGEPELFDPRGWYWGIPGDYEPLNTHPDVHNLYNLLWSESIYEGYQRNNHQQRPFILSRSGTAGIQRYGTVMWSGDISSLLSSLAAHLNVQMHMSLSGMDYYGADIGGFFRQGGDESQMYTQWFANGMAFDVPGRVHTFNLCNCQETAPDRIGDMPSNLQNIRQRYELAPYLYSLAHRAFLFGEPVFPPLVYYYQTDTTVRELGGQKLIGRDLLVAGIAESDATENMVYLPAGMWVNYHNGEWMDSIGEWIGPVSLYPQDHFTLPVYARAGAILPQMYVDEGTLNIMGKRLDGLLHDELILQIYASPEPTEFTLYEDDGETIAYRSGEVRTTIITQQLLEEKVVVSIEAAQGAYQGAPEVRDNLVKLSVEGRLAREVTLNGSELTEYASLSGLDIATSGWVNAENGLIIAKSGVLPVVESKTLEFVLGFPNQ